MNPQSHDHLILSIFARRELNRWGYQLEGFPSLDRMVCGRLVSSTIAQLEAYAILHCLNGLTYTKTLELQREFGLEQSERVRIRIRSCNRELIESLRDGMVCNRICPIMLKPATWTALLKEFRKFDIRFTVANTADLLHVRSFLANQLEPRGHGEHLVEADVISIRSK